MLNEPFLTASESDIVTLKLILMRHFGLPDINLDRLVEVDQDLLNYYFKERYKHE